MVKIFISYRRNDSEKATTRIAKKLKQHFGDANVVLDKDTFLLGKDFREEIMSHLNSSNIVLVIIGEFWHSIMQDRYVNNPSDTDWVIQEIETALREEKLVIPLMLDGTSIPPTEVLPASLAQLPNQNGMNINSSILKFDNDIRRLIQQLEKTLGIHTKPKLNTKEYLDYLLLNSRWPIGVSGNFNQVYVCEDDTTYRIVEDILSEEAEEYSDSEWINNFAGKHKIYPVYITHNGIILDKTYFVSVCGAKYFVPMPTPDGTIDNLIYYWDAKSIELQLATHIARFHSLHPTLEKFAAYANIELRE